MNTAICVAIAAGGAVVVLPTSEITLGWTHTVEQTRWEEDYSVSSDGLAVTEARIEAYGAGMEAPASAVRDGRWTRYRPALPALKEITLANSGFAAGYTVCWHDQCRLLRTMVPQGRQVTLTYASCTAAVGSVSAAVNHDRDGE